MKFIDHCALRPVSVTPDSAWQKHAPFTNWLLDKVKPKSIVELGVHNGFSFFVFCEYAKLFDPECKCYGIDHWLGDDHAGEFGAEVYENFMKLQQHYIDQSVIIRSSFEEARERFPNSSIEMLHIDGRHYYEDVKSDFESWSGKLKNDAIVLFHDTQVKENSFGVNKYWQELTSNFPNTFEFTHGHGLGVLCYGRGDTLAQELLHLFRAPEETKIFIRSLYTQLGNSIHFEYLLNQYNIQYLKY